jgi:type IV pilus assembly protein PilQ
VKKVLVFLFIFLSFSTLAFAKWDNSQMFNRTSVDENIKDILTAIAKQNSSQIIFDKNIEGVETLSIDSMPLEGAFNLIIERNNLKYKWQNNTLIVSSNSNRGISKEFIILDKLSTTKLKELLIKYNLYTGLKNKIIFDDSMQSIFIEDKSETIAELKELIKKFEVAEQLKQQRVAQQKEYFLKTEEYKRLQAKKRLEREKKEKYGLDEYDDWKMVVEVITLKYINVSSTKMEFQGETIEVEGLDKTLLGLVGTGYVTKEDAQDPNKPKYIKEEKPFLKVDKRTNSIIIKDYPDRIAEVRNIVDLLDKPAKLIEVEVTIATGSTGFTEQLGVKLGGSTTTTGGSRAYGISTADNVAENINNLRTTATTTTTTTSTSGVTTTSEAESLNSAFSSTELLQPTGALGLSSSMLFLGAKNALNFQLNAMEEEGLGKVISNPKVITLNNREATIVSGNSISIPTATSDKMGLETIDTGISIKATPHLIERKDDNEKQILLDITIENSALGTVTREQIETSKNKINSNVIIKDGQTLILGGLFQYTKSDSHGGVPVLKDIPILGLLFSTKNESLNKNELLFFITPRVVTSDAIDSMQNGKYQHYQSNLAENKNKFNKDLEAQEKKEK